MLPWLEGEGGSFLDQCHVLWSGKLPFPPSLSHTAAIWSAISETDVSFIAPGFPTVHVCAGVHLDLHVRPLLFFLCQASKGFHFKQEMEVIWKPWWQRGFPVNCEFPYVEFWERFLLKEKVNWRSYLFIAPVKNVKPHFASQQRNNQVDTVNTVM